ncbi:hypothetical protein ACRAWD_27470 [Caulobacter segnis]
MVGEIRLMATTALGRALMLDDAESAWRQLYEEDPTPRAEPMRCVRLDRPHAAVPRPGRGLRHRGERGSGPLRGRADPRRRRPHRRAPASRACRSIWTTRGWPRWSCRSHRPPTPSRASWAGRPARLTTEGRPVP